MPNVKDLNSGSILGTLGDFNITTHFKRSEFSQPALYGLKEESYPEIWIKDRLLPLCQILEIIRSEFRNMPITILSGGGYRSRPWNVLHHAEHPGASLASQHCEGRAADIRIEYYEARDIHSGIISLHNRGIIKLGGIGLYSSFVHIDIRNGNELAQWKG